MGHFTISLPNSQHGDVRCGTVRKMSTFLNLLKGGKLIAEIKKGYIIKVGLTSNEQKEYRLLKTKEGNWTSEDDAGFRVSPHDQISAEIKKAIDEYESQH